MVQDVNELAVNTIRALAGDMTRGANSGHPGAPMGCAPMAHVLFTQFLNVNPKNPDFIGRDRFVLSNGHGCALQYILLHLLGYDLSMQDLKNFRQVGSKTPGHPEATDTPGIEVTTGPLGQGISNAVGLAAAEAHLAASYNRPDYPIFNNYTYTILGDGCLQEGVAAEAVSLAGHWKLGKLIALYDANNITIDGNIGNSFTEDVGKRFEAYGWHVLEVEDGNHDLPSIAKAIQEAQAVTDKPTIIKIKTTIGYGSLIENNEKVHGSPLTDEDLVQLKKKFGLNPEEKYQVPQSVYELYAARTQHGQEYENGWNALFEKYGQAYPKEASEIRRRFAGELPEGWESALPRFTPDDAALATRKSSEVVLNAIANGLIPDFTSGCADLSTSTLNRWKTAVDFQHPSTGIGEYGGQYFRYGVREHGMFAIMNGMAHYGGIIPIGATFLNFLTYGWGAVRLAALSHLSVIYIMTHDSIGLGEDGPTHQPIEILALTRATPNLLTFRPGDANEVAGTWAMALKNRHRPSVFCLSRQAVPNLEGSSLEAVSKGAYVLQDAADAKVVLVGTGSEVCIAVDAAKELATKSISARVVSMPCAELYDEQPDAYKQQVFPPHLPIVSVEALSVRGWERYAHAHVGMKGFGASGPYKDLYKKFNITPEAVTAKAEKTIAHFQKLGYVPQLGVEI